MSFERNLGRLMFLDGLEELRTGNSYFLLSGENVDLSSATPRWRLGLERCLAKIEGSRSYGSLLDLLSEGELGRMLEEIPVVANASKAELRSILRDLIWRRGLRDGQEPHDAEVTCRWFLKRIASRKAQLKHLHELSPSAPRNRSASEFKRRPCSGASTQ